MEGLAKLMNVVLDRAAGVVAIALASCMVIVVWRAFPDNVDGALKMMGCLGPFLGIVVGYYFGKNKGTT